MHITPSSESLIVTFQAAQKNDRNWVGVELHDCSYISARLEEEFPDSVGKKQNFDLERLFVNRNLN